MSDKSSSSSGIGFGGLLTVAFIVLKLCGVINWSWWWVLSPAWIGGGLVLLVLAVAGIMLLLKRREEKRLIEIIQREKVDMKQ